MKVSCSKYEQLTLQKVCLLGFLSCTDIHDYKAYILFVLLVKPYWNYLIILNLRTDVFIEIVLQYFC